MALELIGCNHTVFGIFQWQRMRRFKCILLAYLPTIKNANWLLAKQPKIARFFSKSHNLKGIILIQGYYYIFLQKFFEQIHRNFNSS